MMIFGLKKAAGHARRCQKSGNYSLHLFKISEDSQVATYVKSAECIGPEHYDLSEHPEYVQVVGNTMREIRANLKYAVSYRR